MATFGLITCDSPSSAHTPPKLHSYEHSYQTWGHAPGQPALKGSSYSHADSIVVFAAQVECRGRYRLQIAVFGLSDLGRGLCKIHNQLVLDMHCQTFACRRNHTCKFVDKHDVCTAHVSCVQLGPDYLICFADVRTCEIQSAFFADVCK